MSNRGLEFGIWAIDTYLVVICLRIVIGPQEWVGLLREGRWRNKRRAQGQRSSWGSQVKAEQVSQQKR